MPAWRKCSFCLFTSINLWQMEAVINKMEYEPGFFAAKVEKRFRSTEEDRINERIWDRDAIPWKDDGCNGRSKTE